MRSAPIPIVLICGFVFWAATTNAAKSEGRSSVAVSLRRLTAFEYRNSIADIFGKDIEVRGRFEPPIRVGGLLAASTALLSVTPAGFDAYSKMADDIAKQVVDEKHRNVLVPCVPKSSNAPDDGCATDVLRRYGLLLFRRPLTTLELRERVELVRKMALSDKDFYVGLRYGLATLLQSSKFLFRTETAVRTDGNRLSLEAYSRATRLSFLMWDATPDVELLRAAERGDLETQAGLGKQINRLMSSPRLDVGMRAFFADMWQLDTLENVSKDGLLYPNWSVAIAASAREETLRSTIGLALHSDGDMRDLLTTRKTYINRNLASVYDIPFAFGGEWLPVEFPIGSGRSGIVTQVSMLSMFSHPGRSSPTKRGVALMDIFLCEPTPAPPANVDFSAVNDPTGPLTVRERLMAHASNAACASCHTHSDPIGLSLEGFDTIGGRRLTANGQILDLSAAIKGNSFKDGDGLGQYLRNNPKYPACIARKLYSYAEGLNSEDVDPSKFKYALTAFTSSGYRFRGLLRGIVENPEFFSSATASSDALVGGERLTAK